MEETTSGRPDRKKSRRSKKSAVLKTVKACIKLSEEMDFKLSVYAKMTGVDRSTVVDDMLRDKIGSLAISLRGQKTGGDGEAATAA